MSVQVRGRVVAWDAAEALDFNFEWTAGVEIYIDTDHDSFG